jgi:hypothetical protein
MNQHVDNALGGYQASAEPANLPTALGRKPDFVIGDPSNPYLLRWWVIPRNRVFNIYLHKILRSDDDRALHDHPWWNMSIILKGGYVEYVPGGSYLRKAGHIICRRATAQHRLALFTIRVELDGTRGADGYPLASRFLAPCWSLFITGPKIRDWGFWCPQGFKRWQDFVSPNNPGEVGPGCND